MDRSETFTGCYITELPNGERTYNEFFFNDANSQTRDVVDAVSVSFDGFSNIDDYCHGDETDLRLTIVKSPIVKSNLDPSYKDEYGNSD